MMENAPCSFIFKKIWGERTWMPAKASGCICVAGRTKAFSQFSGSGLCAFTPFRKERERMGHPALSVLQHVLVEVRAFPPFRKERERMGHGAISGLLRKCTNSGFPS